MRPTLLLLVIGSSHGFRIDALLSATSNPQLAFSPTIRSPVFLMEKEKAHGQFAHPTDGPSFGSHIALPLVTYAALGALSSEAIIHLGANEMSTWLIMVLTVFFPVAMQLWICSSAEGVAERMGGRPADIILTKYAIEAANAVGITPPDAVYELDAQEPNAFATSNLFAASPSVAVTRGLREQLSPIELKAVLAHEMGHLRRHDVVRNMHIAVATAGMAGIYEAGRIVLNSRERSDSNSDSESDGSIAILGLGLLAAGLFTQGLANLARLCASRDAEIQADRAAAAAFGADAMISALRKIDRLAGMRSSDLRESAAGKAFAFAMISDGKSVEATECKGWMDRATRAATHVLRTHPPLDERIAALEQAVAEGLVPARIRK